MGNQEPPHYPHQRPDSRCSLEQDRHPQIPSTELVDTVFGVIKQTLESGEDIMISRFGKFSVRKKQARRGRNPLSDITKPFKLGGTLAHPSLQIDVAGSVTTIGAALLRPAGWTYLLVSGSSGEKTPCELAMEAAGKVHPRQRKPEKEEGR